MNYKIIAMDMDGTLLNDDKSISKYNEEMIYKAMKSGVKVVISSGRLPVTLGFYIDTVFKNQPVICCNGAIVLDENKNIIKSNLLDKEAILKVIDILREKKDTYYHFYSDNILYSERVSHATRKFYKFNENMDRDFRLEIKIIKDSKEFIQNNGSCINKMVVIDKDIDYLNELREKINEVSKIDTTKSDIHNIEIISKGVSKGSGLKFLAEYYHISIDECIAVGNDENDESMIKEAGLGIAVANAREFLKKSADYVTEKDNNNGAIGEVIKKFI
ncbi:Cof-type HAD-IIB family hydrolase [Clostridium sp. AWRP]|uniref:Cof-type HAD-IIB family hydrolase n=1 Tax=Clostridium sp. AWRP TaxID=2212991 RepID=UPI000FDC1712|nr:Cof-type HAD-IIB family hydrolase [Clostridium sp. AWRP]AZV56146.1 Cof-type HAD-IIB family hydrolase [Clostridium sp. AWRP]